MRIVMTIPGLELTSGVSVFCVESSNALAASGHDVTVLCSRRIEYRPSDKVRLVIGKTMGAVCRLPCANWRGVSNSSCQPDIVHVHAVWSLFSIRAMLWCLRHHIPFVVSPHGGLMPRVFKKGWLKKWTFWHLLLKPLMRRAAAIHCTAEAEREVCEKLGLRGAFVIAPLGVHLPSNVHPWTSNFGSSSPSRTVLFLGRLSEEKGLANLLDAWHRLQKDLSSTISHFSFRISHFPKLVLAGPDWGGYKKVLDEKIAADHIENVEFTGPVHGAEKDRLYREADIFVLPSPMENFSMVILEALAYGVPVIATKGTPWSELESEKCGCWIDQGVAPLRDALAQLLDIQPSTLSALGANGRALAARKYQWPAIAETLLSCYKQQAK